jgi:hypothetical protein
MIALAVLLVPEFAGYFFFIAHLVALFGFSLGIVLLTGNTPQRVFKDSVIYNTRF